MFASQVTDTVTVGTVAVTIRKMGWRALRDAAEAHSAAALALLAKAGAGARAATEAAEKAEAREPKVDQTPEQKRDARYRQYDRGAVLRSGIKSWTASDKVTPQQIDDLDEDVADTLHRAILDLSLPPIDHDEQAAVKNG